MYAIDRQLQTDVRRASSFNAPTLGAGHNKSVAMHIAMKAYDALCATRLSWLVIILAMLHQLKLGRCA